MKLMLADQSQSQIHNPVFLLVGQHQIRGGNFKLMNHLTSCVLCTDSSFWICLSSGTQMAKWQAERRHSKPTWVKILVGQDRGRRHYLVTLVGINLSICTGP